MANKGQRIIQTEAGKAQAEAHMSFALSVELKEKIKEVAKEREVSASRFIRIAVEGLLDQLS